MSIHMIIYSTHLSVYMSIHMAMHTRSAAEPSSPCLYACRYTCLCMSIRLSIRMSFPHGCFNPSTAEPSLPCPHMLYTRLDTCVYHGALVNTHIAIASCFAVDTHMLKNILGQTHVFGITHFNDALAHERPREPLSLKGVNHYHA